MSVAQSPRGLRWAWAYLALALLVIVTAVIIREYPFINRDVAFNLVTGRKMVAGVPLYVDWIDNNPPSIYLLSALVAWLAQGSAQVEITLYSLLFLGISAAGILVIIRTQVLKEHGELIAALVWAQLFITLGASIHVNEFGQREALFLLVFLPHLSVRTWGAQQWRTWPLWLLTIGFLAAMKPQFVALLVWAELCAAASARRVPWRDWSALTAGLLLPFGLLYLHHPEAFWQFFTVVVPFHLAEEAGVYDASWTEVPARIGWTSIVLISATGLGWVAAGFRGVLQRREMLILGGTLLGSVLVVAQQGRLYAYHFLLPAGLAGLLLAVLAVRIWREHPGKLRLLAGLAGGVLLSNLAALVRIELWAAAPTETQLNEELAGHERVLFVSTSVLHVRGYYYSGIDPVGPWGLHFTLPLLSAVQAPEERAWRLEGYAGFMAEHLESKKPTAVVFSPNNQALIPFRPYTFPAAYTLLADHLPLEDYSGRFANIAGTWIILERE